MIPGFIRNNAKNPHANPRNRDFNNPVPGKNLKTEICIKIFAAKQIKGIKICVQLSPIDANRLSER